MRYFIGIWGLIGWGWSSIAWFRCLFLKNELEKEKEKNKLLSKQYTHSILSLSELKDELEENNKNIREMAIEGIKIEEENKLIKYINESLIEDLTEQRNTSYLIVLENKELKEELKFSRKWWK